MESVLRQFIEESKQSNGVVRNIDLQECKERSAIGFVILRVGEHNCGGLQSSVGSHSFMPSSLGQFPPFNRTTNTPYDEYLCYSTRVDQVRLCTSLAFLQYRYLDVQEIASAGRELLKFLRGCG